MRVVARIKQLGSGKGTESILDQIGARHSEMSVISSLDDQVPAQDDFLVDLLITAAGLAREVDLTKLLDRCTSTEDHLFVQTWPGEHYRLLPALAQALGAHQVVEVGTYHGHGALALHLVAGNVLTYDINPWQTFSATVLRESDFDEGIEQRIGDLSDPGYFASQVDSLRDADLIFVDGPKDGYFEQAFGDLLYAALDGSGTVVMWDDIRLMSMVWVWRKFPVPKLDATSFGHWSGTGLTHST